MRRRQSTGRPRAIGASRVLADSPERVYAFLARLENHALLHDRYLRLACLDADRGGGVIVVGAPLGLHRTARTAVTSVSEPRRLAGTAAIGRRTRARVQWCIEPLEDGAGVRLEAVVDELGRLDALLLAAGGRWWLRRRFRVVLARLARALGGGAVAAARPGAVVRPVPCGAAAA